MNAMENTRNLESNFNNVHMKQRINALTLKTQAFIKLLFKKKELDVFENRLRIMNESNSVLNGMSVNLKGHINETRHTRFKECLDNMPTLQRAAFQMKTFDNYKTAFICEYLDISENLFWNLVNKSRKELIEALECL